jgi:hypothetical protein
MNSALYLIVINQNHMKNIFTFLVFLNICLSSASLYAEVDSVTCSVFVYPKASVGCNVYTTYSGNATSAATFVWNFNGGVIVSGSGPGPYYIHWDTAGYKTVSVYVSYQGQYCSASKTIHIVPQPSIYDVTGGGSYTYGGTGVHIGLSGSQPGYGYYLYLNNGTSSIANKTGDGNSVDFGLFTTTGTYYCKAKVDSSSSSCLVNMHDSAVVTINGYVPEQYICMVTYDTASQYNRIIWNKVTGYHLAHFNIYKQTARENVFAKIAQVPYVSFSSWVDTSANPIIMAQKYEMSVSDSSGNESVKSPYHKTVHLEVSPGIQGFNLIWNPYEGFTFLTYRIYRKLNNGSWQLIDSVASDQISYTDPYITSGLMTYYIEVLRYAPCNPSIKSGIYESVVSNTMTSAPLGIDQVNTNGILLYPNPARDKLNLLLPASGNISTNIYIYAMDGQKYPGKLITQARTELDISSLPAGMYFLRLISQDGTKTIKFVKD